jgi:hypothetical protein
LLQLGNGNEGTANLSLNNTGKWQFGVIKYWLWEAMLARGEGVGLCVQAKQQPMATAITITCWSAEWQTELSYCCNLLSAELVLTDLEALNNLQKV